MSTRNEAATAFADRAIAAGHITPAERDNWRALYIASPERVEVRLGEHVERAQRTGRDQVNARPGDSPRDIRARAVCAANRVDYDKAVKYAAAFGAKDPRGAVAKFAAGVE